MGYPVTLNGRTYTLADFEGQNYVDGLPDAFEDFVTHAGNLYSTTSTTSNSIGTGSKTFTVESSKPYQVGTPLRITDSAAPTTNWMDGIVTAYSGTTLTVSSVSYAGSGTKTSWNINIGGGAVSYTGTLPVAQGGTGATTAASARTNLDVYSKTETDSRYLNVSGESANVTLGGDVIIDSGDANPLTIKRTAASQNLSIKFEGTTNTVYTGLDNLSQDYMIGTAPDLSADATRIARFDVSDLAVELFHDGDLKLATKAAGIDVTGRVLADELRIDGNSAFYTPSSGTLTIGAFGGSSVEIQSTGKIKYDANDPSGSHLFQTNAVTMAEITQTGNLNLTGGGGDVILSNGAGIDFSATGNSSGTTGSELFDDYEEGAFNPTIEGLTLNSSDAFYRKIGRVVHCWITFSSSSVTDSDDARLGGFPFTIAGQTGAGRAAGFISYTSGTVDYGLLFRNGEQTAQFREMPGGNVATRTAISGTLFWLQVCYASTT